jgi:hypothetical protein
VNQIIKLFFIVIVCLYSKQVYSCPNYNVISTVVDGKNSFAIINTNEFSKWKKFVKVGDFLNNNVVVNISYEKVIIYNNIYYCTITRKPITDSYLDWSSDYSKQLNEKIQKYNDYQFLIGLIDKDLQTLILDGGRDSNIELWDNLINKKLDIKLSIM